MSPSTVYLVFQEHFLSLTFLSDSIHWFAKFGYLKYFQLIFCDLFAPQILHCLIHWTQFLIFLRDISHDCTCTSVHFDLLGSSVKSSISSLCSMSRCGSNHPRCGIPSWDKSSSSRHSVRSRILSDVWQQMTFLNSPLVESSTPQPMWNIGQGCRPQF